MSKRLLWVVEKLSGDSWIPVTDAYGALNGMTKADAFVEMRNWGMAGAGEKFRVSAYEPRVPRERNR